MRKYLDIIIWVLTAAFVILDILCDFPRNVSIIGYAVIFIIATAELIAQFFSLGRKAKNKSDDE